MPLQRLVISGFQTGLETDLEPFNLNNDAFPVINNGTSWRARVRRKRGTSKVGRLQRDFTAATAFTLSTTANGAIYTNADIFADAAVNFRTTQPGSSLVAGSLRITVGAVTFVDNGLGVLVGTPGTNSGTVNYASASITLNFAPPLGAPTPVVVFFGYYPALPVMGLEDLDTSTINFPTLVAFDQTYSYQFNSATNVFFDVSFFKGSGNRVTWSGQDFEQFFSANYQGALWVVNESGETGDLSRAGMQFRPIATFVLIDPTHATLTFAAPHGLIVGDYIWVNEITQTVFNPAVIVNGMTGRVETVPLATSVTVFFPDANLIGTFSGGIAQYLTSDAARPGIDPIRWYDGFSSPAPVTGFRATGWVNFSPPLQRFVQAGQPGALANPEYLVGAKAVIPFKDRLLFLAPYVQTSVGTVRFFPDRIIYSQNGTAYYTGANAGFSPFANMFPADQTYTLSAWYINVTGFGGFIAAGLQQQIMTVTTDEDVLLIGFEARKTKLIYTSNDLVPFIFQNINTQFTTESTYSAVNLDIGMVDIGSYGIVVTNQNESQRVDLKIVDQIFQFKNTDNGLERVNAIRDFRNEWIYFAYTPENSLFRFPAQTLIYNYREASWSISIENYTHHGTLRKEMGDTWASLELTHPDLVWDTWGSPWDSGFGQARYPDIIGGNQQGYVMIKDNEDTDEDPSGYIQNIDPVTNIVTSHDHCLRNNDFVVIQNVLGMTNVNNVVRRVSKVTNDDFVIDTNINIPISGTYGGLGEFKRISVPFIQTKQFNIQWPDGRGSRIGAQRYLFETTEAGQLTINLYTSQDADNPVTNPPENLVLNPFNNVPENSAEIFSNIVLTTPEPEGFYNRTGAQTWHRQSNSFIGDTVQIAFTLSEAQIRQLDPPLAVDTWKIQPSAEDEIVLHSAVLDLYPAGVIA